MKTCMFKEELIRVFKDENMRVQEKLIRVFKSEKDLGDKLAGRRNWCEAVTSIFARNMPLSEC